MAKYYFLASLLPRLEIGHIPAIGFSELRELLAANLTADDLKKVRELLRLIDIENLRAYFAHEPIEPRGNLNREGLEMALHEERWPDSEVDFPDYLIDFLERYKTPKERIRKFDELLSSFLLQESLKQEGFLKDYFSFERALRLVLVGFRSKMMGKDVAQELTYEDPEEPLIAEILAQKDAAHFEPPYEFNDLKAILEENGDAPMELHKALTEYRFNRIEEFFETDYFGIDRILGYIARLTLVERWLELNLEHGMKVIHTIEGNIS